MHRSITHFSRMVASLAERSGPEHVPWKGGKLTTLLSDRLGVNALVRCVVTVRATVDPESLGEINRAVKDGYVPELLAMYPGLQVLKGGSQEAEAEFFSEITALYTIALFVIYALIAVAFRSYSLPILIMTAMPFGFMGAVFGHLIFNLPMAMFSYFGIGAAAGVVVNDNLVLIDYVRRLEREGMSPPEALVTSAVSRFRPIFLTTVTTFYYGLTSAILVSDDF